MPDVSMQVGIERTCKGGKQKRAPWPNLERRRDFGLAVKFLTLLPSTLNTALTSDVHLFYETGNRKSYYRNMVVVNSHALPSLRFSID
jgi:hypothetical protein